MAVEHPVTKIVRYKLDIAGLSNADKNSVAGPPGGFWLTASFSPRDDELVPVQVDRMVIHPQINQANTNTLSVPHNQRSCSWTRFSIEGEPIELHVHGVRDVDIRKDCVLLQDYDEVLVHGQLVGFFRMHDERADHAHHFLHRHVRVIKVSPFLVQREFVNEPATWWDRVLAGTGRSIHIVWNLETVPVHRCRFGKVIVHDDADTITLCDLNRRTGRD